jgi:CheY-like chemotaxis protein
LTCWKSFCPTRKASPVRKKRLIVGRILILEQREEQIAAYRNLFLRYDLTFAASANEAICAANKSNFQIFLSSLHLDCSNLGDESVFDFVKAVKANPSTRETPFFFCGFKPCAIAEDIYHALESTAKKMGADYFEIVKSGDYSKISRKISVELVKKRSKHENASVLVVDDDIHQRQLLSLQLEKLGILADEAINGAEAVHCLYERQYKLIFMDINMPEMDGYEASHAIRNLELESELEPVPIIAVSSDFDFQRCKESGMNECVKKPMRFETLQVIISTWMTLR